MTEPAMSKIPDFTDEDLNLVSGLLLQRYGKVVTPQLADSEVQLDPASERLDLCPTLYWSERGAHFVVCKVGEGRFRCQFFYAENDQYGTGRAEYDDLGTCVLTLLQVQADHERQRAGVFTGADAKGLSDEDYRGPEII
jgi:hypothetical protein